MLETNLALDHSYEVEELGELPGTGKFSVPVFNFPPANPPGNYGLGLRVRRRGGESWVGFFAGGYTSPTAISRVVSSPDPNRVCVVSKGAGYLVDVDNPGEWERVQLFPVLDVRTISERGLMIFCSFTDLVAYGDTGFVWKSPRVCWDDLKIVSITPDTIEGTGYDPANSDAPKSRFVVDLRTGRSLLEGPTSIDGKPVC